MYVCMYVDIVWILVIDVCYREIRYLNKLVWTNLLFWNEEMVQSLFKLEISKFFCDIPFFLFKRLFRFFIIYLSLFFSIYKTKIFLLGFCNSFRYYVNNLV